MKQMNSTKIVTTLKLSAFAALAVLCCSGCEEQKTVEVPREQNDLFFEVTADSKLGKYDTVLPKIKRYKAMDKKSFKFWGDLENLTVTNHYVKQIRKKLDAGDYKGAEELVDEMLKKHGRDVNREDIREFVTALRKTDETISALHKSITSADIRMHCEELLRIAQELPDNGQIIAFAAAKKADAEALEKLEKARPLFWLYGDAQDKRTEGKALEADAITALIAADNDPQNGARDAMVKDLMNRGMFNVVVPVFNYQINKEGSEENKKKN